MALRQVLAMFSHKRPFVVTSQSGSCHAGLAVITADFARMSVRVMLEGDEIGSDQAPIEGAAGARNLVVRHMLPDGQLLELEANCVSWWTVGIAVRLDGALVHESHPGRKLEWPVMPGTGPAGADQQQREVWSRQERERVRRSTPSLMVDIGLGLLFFLVARETGLQTAAVVGLVAGVVLLLIQRLVPKVDLVGGLALFGIAVMGVSALYAMLVQDEELIKLRPTIMGVAVGLLFLADGLWARGKWLGSRMVRYFPVGTDQLRLTVGIGLAGVVSALANVAVVRLVSTDIWLWYTTFGDMLLSVGLIFVVMYWARPRLQPAPPAPPG